MTCMFVMPSTPTGSLTLLLATWCVAGACLWTFAHRDPAPAKRPERLAPAVTGLAMAYMFLAAQFWTSSAPSHHGHTMQDTRGMPQYSSHP